MSDAFRVRFEGFDSFLAGVKAAPRRMQQEMATAARRIAKRGEGLSSQFASRGTGFMASTIYSETEQAGATVTSIWGATAEYAEAHDKGRRAVTIRAKAAKFLRFEVGGEVFYRKVVTQPARAGKPFVTKAFQMARRGFARQEFEDAIRRVFASFGQGG